VALRKAAIKSAKPVRADANADRREGGADGRGARSGHGAGHTRPASRSKEMEEVLAAAKAIGNERYRARTLRSLASLCRGAASSLPDVASGRINYEGIRQKEL
jgi:hypothetical protein